MNGCRGVGTLKKSYSQWNLLQDKIQGYGQKKGFFDFIFTTQSRYLELSFPYYDFLRGEVFVQDFNDLFEDDSPIMLTVEHLISLLYDDFLTQIKKGTEFESMARFLAACKEKYLEKPQVTERVLKQIQTNLFSFENVEREIPVKPKKEKIAYVTIRLKSSFILRGEIFLHDLAPYLGDQDIVIEELFAILFLDFLDKIKQKGNSMSVMKAILLKLERM